MTSTVPHTTDTGTFVDCPICEVTAAQLDSGEWDHADGCTQPAAPVAGCPCAGCAPLRTAAAGAR